MNNVRMTSQNPSRLPTGVRLFFWVHLRVWWASVRDLIRAPLKLAILVALWSLLLGGVYALAYRGIRFIYDTAGLGPFLLSRLWFLMLFVIMIMLAISQLASTYSTLVRPPETRFWMVLPVSARTLCRAKWMESGFYSAWAAVLLALPLLVAYFAVLQQAPWLVVGIVGAWLIPLVGIVTALATAALLVWLRWLGTVRIRRELLPIGFVLAGSLLFWVLGERSHEQPQQEAWFLALQELLPRMRVAMSMWSPSSWVATALDAGLNSRWVEAGFFTLLLWTTAFVCWRLLDHLAALVLFPVLRQHAQSTEAVSAHVTAKTGPFLVRWWMRRPFFATLTKDVLLVLRDPMQWSQAMVFFGLLGAYFANIHRLAEYSVEPSWRVGIASLNLACSLLVFGSLAVRFVFPQMSLEGRSLWLLRIVGHGMRQLLVSKLCLYGTAGVLVTEVLLVISSSRLGVPIMIRWWLVGVGAVSSLTIVGLTVGLGALWIQPTAQDAARVVSSSYGALTLVFVLGYVGCVVAALVAVWGVGLRHPSTAEVWLASLGLLALSLVTGLLPIRMGLAKLTQLET